MTTQTQSRETKTKPASRSASNANAGTSLGALAGAGAAGVALGVLAMLGRKVAVQAPTALAGPWDQALAAEHKAVLKAFDALEATDDRAITRRTMLLAQMKHALAKHALQEENAVYPALRDAGMIADADALNKEHGYVKQYLYELESTPKDSAKFLDTVRRFRADLEAHMREEEDRLFPALKSNLDEAKNKALTAMMNKEGFKLA